MPRSMQAVPPTRHPTSGRSLYLIRYSTSSVGLKQLITYQIRASGFCSVRLVSLKEFGNVLRAIRYTSNTFGRTGRQYGHLQGQLVMFQDIWKWLELGMVGDSQEWLKIVRSGWRYLGMFRDRQEWYEIVRNGWRQLEVVGGNQEWLKVIRNG